MRSIGSVAKSVKGLGMLACLMFFCAGVLGLLGFLGPAVALISFGVISLVGMVQGIERRRHRAQKELLQTVNALAMKLEQSDARIQQEHKQHTNSVGMLFRELRGMSSAIAGEGSVISLHSERQLATFLRAMSINTRELVQTFDSMQVPGPNRDIQ